MLKNLKENWKGIIIVILASLIIATTKANLKNNSSLAYSVSDIYRFAGIDKNGKIIVLKKKLMTV